MFRWVAGPKLEQLLNPKADALILGSNMKEVAGDDIDAMCAQDLHQHQSAADKPAPSPFP